MSVFVNPPNPANTIVINPPSGGNQVTITAGIAGPVGPQGPQGPQGNQGNPGAAATIAVGTTTTGNAGTNASVVNSGTSSAAVFDFTIPRGAQGIQGPQGPQGEPGISANQSLNTTDSVTFAQVTSPTFKGVDGVNDATHGCQGSDGGSIYLSGYNGNWNSDQEVCYRVGVPGSIDLRGGYNSVDDASDGGSIIMVGANTGNGAYGAGSINTSGADGGAGGSINTSGGNNDGGSINTSDGGGSIDTRGTGVIELGSSGTRTTLSGNAVTQNRAIALPDADGTIALSDQSLYTTDDVTFHDADITNLHVFSAATIDEGLTVTAPYATTLGGDATLQGTNNTAPNQTAASGSSLMTRDLGDARYALIQSFKNSSQIDVTTGTLVDVTGMTGITLEANTIYRVEFFGRITVATSAIFAARLVSDQNLSLSTGSYSGLISGATVTNGVSALSATIVSFSSRAGSVTGVSHGAIFALITGASAPTVKVQIQQSGTAGNTASLLANSVISFTKLV